MATFVIVYQWHASFLLAPFKKVIVFPWNGCLEVKNIECLTRVIFKLFFVVLYVV